MGVGYGPQMNGPNQIVVRQMTSSEMDFGTKMFHAFQIQMRVISFIPLIMVIINMLFLSNNVIISLVALIFGFIVMAMGLGLMATRKKIKGVMTKGKIIEIMAPAYRSKMARGMASFTIGPVSILDTPEVRALIIEGSLTWLVCIPELQMAITVNNVRLVRGARISFPPNLEAMGQPALYQEHYMGYSPPPY